MNAAKLYVGNLPYTTTEDELQDFFGQYGEISQCKLISDQETGRSKGFAFVTFASEDAGKAALEANEQELNGRKIIVNVARDKREGGGGGRRPNRY